MSRRARLWLRAAGPALAFGALAIVSCGDVGSDLITRGSASADSCRQDQDCPADHPRCGDGRCLQCLERSDCSDGQACTLPAGTCVPGCPNQPCPLASPVCEAATGLCRGCTANTECPATSARCDVATGRCVECSQATQGEDCPGIEQPYCEPQSGRCVECISEGHCGDQMEDCSPISHRCAVPCTATCPIDEPHCDQAEGFCAECRTSDECEAGEICRNSECVEEL